MAPPQRNVDPDELGHFSRLAEHWWDPTGPCAPLHAINPLRLSWIEQQAGSVRGRAVADIGCGGGILAEAMARHGGHVVGIDLAADAIDAARAHAQADGIGVDYRLLDAESLAAQAPRAFDVVTCMEMLEHVPDPRAIVAACARLLRPGGIAVLSTINRTPKAWLEAIVGAEYVLGLLPRGTHRYARFIRPHELSQWARELGLTAIGSSGLSYNPVARRYYLCDSLDVNYMLAFHSGPADDDA